MGLPIDTSQSVLGLDMVGSRLFVLYDDMTLIEVNLLTNDIVDERNIADIENAQHLAGKKATAFAVFKDINMLVIATDEKVHLFEYEGDLTLATMIPVANVIRIAFVDLFTVLMAESEDGSQATLSFYSMDVNEPEGSLTINQFLGQKIIMHPGDQAIYYATGT